MRHGAHAHGWQSGHKWSTCTQLEGSVQFVQLDRHDELSVHALDTVERRGNRIVTQTRNCAHDGRPHNVEGDGNNCENLDPVIFAGNNVE